jgi:hypothetical protein
MAYDVIILVRQECTNVNQNRQQLGLFSARVCNELILCLSFQTKFISESIMENFDFFYRSAMIRNRDHQMFFIYCMIWIWKQL